MEISLTRGKVTIIDEADRWVVALGKWCAVPNGKKHIRWYATRRHEGKTIYLHRVIMGEPEGMDVDHINGDGLDNRRENLRIATRSQNSRNAHTKPKKDKTSQYKGVSWWNYSKIKAGGYWRAEIELPGRKRVHHVCKDEEEAARVYDVLATQHFGAFAQVNFPGEPLRYDLIKPPRVKTSQYHGVHWVAPARGIPEGRWKAVLYVPGGKPMTKMFTVEEDAARAYDAFAAQYLGADAVSNFPGEPAQPELIQPKARHSQYRGVCWAKHARLAAGGQWIAYITGPDKKRITRYCHSELEAARAYDTLAKAYLGSTAPLNGV